MPSPFDVSKVVQKLDPNQVEPHQFSWRGALLGAAVGIAGPAYIGTLITNVTVRLLLAQGYSAAEAYAYIGEITLSLPAILMLISGILFALLGGFVSASFAPNRSLAQGLSAGLIVLSFMLIMLIGPSSNPGPLWSMLLEYCIAVLGSIGGAYAYARRA